MNSFTVKDILDSIDDYLVTKEEVETFHKLIMKRQGEPARYINESHLDSALGGIKTSLYYQDETLDIITIAYLYAERVALAHAFVDGNKRAGYAAMKLFLAKLNKDLDMDSSEQADLMVNITTKAYSQEHFIMEIKDCLYNLS